MSEGTSIGLLANEAEAYVQAIKPYEVKDIGHPKWSLQHEYLEKLNMQAGIQAINYEDEFVKEYLITHDKIPILVHELLATEIWKQNIFPEILALDPEREVTFPVYIVLYHEATVVTLLETVLFHGEACLALDDSVLDLIDYCYRKLTYLSALGEEDEEEDDEEEALASQSHTTSLQELEKQDRKLNFAISIKAITILNSIIMQLSQLGLSAATRILNTHDIPMLIVHLLDNSPWSKTSKGKLMKYIDNKWTEVTPPDRHKLTKTEGQVWMALYTLLMDEECQKKYELDTYRKNVIMKLRSYLTEIMLDQLPMLGDMQRYLEQLSFMEPPPAKKELVLEQVPEIRENILKEYEGEWKKIAKKQNKTFFNASKMDMKAQAKSFADIYNWDRLESLISEPPRCALCGAEASKRCSRCQNEWYCRRECQVNHWKKHKTACNLLMDALAKAKESGLSQVQDTS